MAVDSSHHPPWWSIWANCDNKEPLFLHGPGSCGPSGRVALRRCVALRDSLRGCGDSLRGRVALRDPSRHYAVFDDPDRLIAIRDVPSCHLAIRVAIRGSFLGFDPSLRGSSDTIRATICGVSSSNYAMADSDVQLPGVRDPSRVLSIRSYRLSLCSRRHWSIHLWQHSSPNRC